MTPAETDAKDPLLCGMSGSCAPYAVRVATSDLEMLSDAYESAERQFTDAVRFGAARSHSAARARAVAATADRFHAEAYRRYHNRADDAWMSLDQLTERTEVLAEL